MLTLARRLHEMSWLIELTSQGSFGLWIWFLATCVLQLSDTCGFLCAAWNIVTQEIALRWWRNWVRVALVLCTSCESHAPGLHRWHVCPWIPWISQMDLKSLFYPGNPSEKTALTVCCCSVRTSFDDLKVARISGDMESLQKFITWSLRFKDAPNCKLA